MQLKTAIPGLADSGLVVRPLVSDRAIAGTLGALNASVDVDLDGMASAGIWIGATTLVGTLGLFVSADGGTTWAVASVVDANTVLVSTVVNPAANSQFTAIHTGAARKFRVQVTAYTSGTAAAIAIASTRVLALPANVQVAGVASLFLGVSGGIDSGGLVRGMPVQNAVPLAASYAVVTRPIQRQLITYDASYRLGDATAGQLSLTFTFVANTNKQLGTIYHGAGATKTVRIRRISLWVALGAAGTYNFEVRALSATTAPATGNPAITSRAHDGADAAAEATCLALPTTAGSLVGADTGTLGLPVEWLSGAGAGPTNPSATAGQEIVLYESFASHEGKPLVMRAGVAEGFAINGRCTAAVALRYTILIRFTEE